MNVFDGHSVSLRGVGRREFLRAGLGTLAGFAGLALADEPTKPGPAKDADYLSAAREAARWLESCRVVDGDTSVWPADPRNPKSVTPNLYSGVAGVALFWLEAHRATGDDKYLDFAKGAANYLRKQIPEGTGAV